MALHMSSDLRQRYVEEQAALLARGGEEAQQAKRKVADLLLDLMREGIVCPSEVDRGDECPCRREEA